jgi:hypothetical protein
MFPSIEECVALRPVQGVGQRRVPSGIRIEVIAAQRLTLAPGRRIKNPLSLLVDR